MALLLTGCFYLDPVNERPAAQIVPPAGPLHRGDRVTVMAQFDDPEGQPGTYSWRVFACSGLVDGRATDCSDKIYEQDQPVAEFGVPVAMTSQLPVQAVRVELNARDDRGAVAPAFPLVLPVADAVPTLVLRRTARSYAVGAPIEMFASYGDADDGPLHVRVEWTVFTPASQPAYVREDIPVASDPTDPAHITVGQRLVPGGTGEWDVKVTASDGLETTEKHLVFTVIPDQPPCIERSQPLAPPDGVTLPIAEPTVFQVPLVDDDLDPYPPLNGPPQFGTTRFAWSIKPPGAARQTLVGATGSSVDFDPAAFTPGDIVELRVEIFDRAHSTLPCADPQPTCSLSSTSCIQRQTWRVEVR